ncbi:uncharacterized protein LOC129592927 [Paramacrobiotus metropolitanus]|uniref:uncharacterized protein LOC129592927 n=1 Tax=Paramacrobiotus metropolitanus TaxID=2943436 RepID=UPI002445B68B|nr:uncharacterized protein LOC129592927 [Paramacrobiotus metropolitanus]
MEYIDNIVSQWARRSWLVYHETMLEAVLVVWLSIEMSEKFDARFYPEMRVTRVDVNALTGVDSLLNSVGLTNDYCVWDCIMDPWLLADGARISKPRFSHRANPTENQFPVGSRKLFGRFGLVVLYVSMQFSRIHLIGSLIANRHGRSPQWNGHLSVCHQLTHILTFGHTEFFASNSWRRFVKNAISLCLTCSGFVVLSLVKMVGQSFLVTAFIGLNTGIYIYASFQSIGDMTLYVSLLFVLIILNIYCGRRIAERWMVDSYWTYFKERCFREDESEPTETETATNNLAVCECDCLQNTCVAEPTTSQKGAKTTPVLNNRWFRLHYLWMNGLAFIYSSWAVYCNVAAIDNGLPQKAQLGSCTGRYTRTTTASLICLSVILNKATKRVQVIV